MVMSPGAMAQCAMDGQWAAELAGGSWPRAATSGASCGAGDHLSGNCAGAGGGRCSGAAPGRRPGCTWRRPRLPCWGWRGETGDLEVRALRGAWSGERGKLLRVSEAQAKLCEDESRSNGSTGAFQQALIPDEEAQPKGWGGAIPG